MRTSLRTANCVDVRDAFVKGVYSRYVRVEVDVHIFKAFVGEKVESLKFLDVYCVL